VRGPQPPPVAVGASPATGRLAIRLLAPTDSIRELTQLLHRAYAKQVAMGLRPLAGRQDDETTRRRCAAGECFVALRRDDPSGGGGARAGKAEHRERIVGTILFHEVEDAEGPAWFRRKDVDYFSQFAVDPDLQGQGIGRLLLDHCERQALENGAKELACSMAEPDRELYDFYIRRGYRLIGHWQWPYTNYKSAILSKAIGAE
jgi:GNAT superfamily N-acetyltransferase